MRLSVSKIGEYEKCPYSFFLTSIKKESRGMTPIQLKEGIEKHEIFEKAVLETKKVLTEGKDPIETLKTNIGNHPDYQQYKNDCDNFVKFSNDIKLKGGDPMPEYVEIKLYNPKLNFSGIIDRVDVDGENILILDYKTGKDHPVDDYTFQLSVYAYMFEQQFKKEVTHWGIFFSRSGNFELQKVDRESFQMSLDRIDENRKLIDLSLNNMIFPKSPNYLCKWCTWFQNGKCDGKDTPPTIPVK